ncbi:MAG TPA: hypothetical protein VH482_19470 [Thermomicrobiales bacterium]|jgi:hypothetical protein
MSRSTPSFFDRLRMALNALVGRQAKPAPAYATVPVRRFPRRTTPTGRW